MNVMAACSNPATPWRRLASLGKGEPHPKQLNSLEYLRLRRYFIIDIHPFHSSTYEKVSIPSQDSVVVGMDMVMNNFRVSLHLEALEGLVGQNLSKQYVALVSVT